MRRRDILGAILPRNPCRTGCKFRNIVKHPHTFNFYLLYIVHVHKRELLYFSLVERRRKINVCRGRYPYTLLRRAKPRLKCSRSRRHRSRSTTKDDADAKTYTTAHKTNAENEPRLYAETDSKKRTITMARAFHK